MVFGIEIIYSGFQVLQKCSGIFSAQKPCIPFFAESTETGVFRN